jgi:hypothetical protein
MIGKRKKRKDYALQGQFNEKPKYYTGLPTGMML